MELRQNSIASIFRQIAIDINYDLQFDGKKPNRCKVSELRQNSSSEAMMALIFNRDLLENPNQEYWFGFSMI